MALFENPHSASDTLPIFLIQLFIVLVVTRLLGRILKWIHQPAVIGEIIGGIILGPSVLGHANGWTSNIFPASSLGQFILVADVGLMFFMFLLGLELDPSVMKRQGKLAAPIAIPAVLFPFFLGSMLSLWVYDEYSTSQVNRVAFILFFGASMSFTAFPVLAAILKSYNLLADPMGVLAFSCAAIDDIVAWCVLAFASSFATSKTAINGLYTSLIAFGYVLFMMFVVRPVLHRVWLHFKPPRETEDKELSRVFVTLLFLVLIASSFFTESIGIHFFFGAFMAGIVVPKSGSIVETLAPKIELVVVDFLLPLYFAQSGLKLNLGDIHGPEDSYTVLAILGVACVGKFLPTFFMSKLVTKQSWRFCASLGVLMNTRGLVQLIVLNLGLSLKILSTKLFTIMIIMAIVTTFITSPVFYYSYVKDHASKPKKHRRRGSSNAEGSTSPTLPGVGGGVGLEMVPITDPGTSGSFALPIERTEFSSAMHEVRNILRGEAPIQFDPEEERSIDGAAPLEAVHKIATDFEAARRRDGGNDDDTTASGNSMTELPVVVLTRT